MRMLDSYHNTLPKFLLESNSIHMIFSGENRGSLTYSEAREYTTQHMQLYAPTELYE